LRRRNDGALAAVVKFRPSRNFWPAKIMTRMRFAPSSERRKSSQSSRAHPTARSVSATWNHVIERESLNIHKLEHVGIEKVEQRFRGMLWRAAELLFDARHFFELAPNWRPPSAKPSWLSGA
jgi:hypothetical protein